MWYVKYSVLLNMSMKDFDRLIKFSCILSFNVNLQEETSSFKRQMFYNFYGTNELYIHCTKLQGFKIFSYDHLILTHPGNNPKKI